MELMEADRIALAYLKMVLVLEASINSFTWFQNIQVFFEAKAVI